MDEFIDTLLRDERVFDTILPRLTKRFVHEENGELAKRISLIENDLNLEVNEESKKSDNESRYSDSSEFSDHGLQKRRRSKSPYQNRRREKDDRDQIRNRDSESPHSRGRHRDRRSRSHSPRHSRRHRRSRTPERTKKHKDREHKKKSKGANGGDDSKKTEADEIAEMNALRAKLGLKPLKP